MKLVTWNVNSLNVRLPRLLAWLDANAPDVVCLQETKLEDDRFPHAELDAAGYRAHVFGQKTYNGVAILVRKPLEATGIVTGLDTFEDQKRLICATVAGVRIVCAYVPNGEVIGSEKFAYKLAWCKALTSALRTALAAHPRLVFAGDMNIAPQTQDVHDPGPWENTVHFTPPEREVFREWLALGLADSFRLFDQPPNTFSWWDYRKLSFPKNKGLRIDHVLLSATLSKHCTSCTIDRAMRKGEKPSDHVPVVAELAL